MPSEGVGAMAGGQVDLATGEYEHSYSDLFVYNPIGPSVVWQRLYGSLRGYATAYENSDLGANWSHNYNIGVTEVYNGVLGPSGPDSGTNGTYTITLLLPNGAQVSGTTTSPPTSSNHQISVPLSGGVPMTMTWNYDTGNGSSYFIITHPDRTQWITKDLTTSPGNNWFPLGKIIDRNGNYVTLNYTSPSHGYPLLTSIADSNGSALLTFNRASNGNLTSVADRYNRSVYYQVSTYPNQNVPSGFPQSQQELNQVSQVVTTGTSNPPLRFTYGYQNYPNLEGTETVPFLSTITVPSPTGTGNSTATINYSSTTCAITSLVDGNGNSRNYTSVDGTHTKVTIEDPHNNVVYSYTVRFDSNMDVTGQTDGTNTNYVWTATYSDPNDPYRPSSVTNGNNDTWDYTWDQYGNIQTVTTPRNTKTTWTWSYTNFALGELTRYQEGSNLVSGAKSPTTYAYYEPSGLLQSVTYPLPGTTGSSSTVTESYTYDSLGNITQITSPGNNASTNIVTTYNYTTDGSYNQADAIDEPLTMTNNLGKVTHYRYDSQGNLTTFIDALGNETDFTINLANQPVQDTYPATGQTGSGRAYTLNAYLYPGGPLTSISQYDESGSQARQISYSYGQEGETLSVSGSTEPVTYTYDAAYRTKSLADGNSNLTSYSFNTAGYLSQVSYPLNNGAFDTISYPSYDNDGHLLKRLDGNSVETDYVYNDPESRLTNINYPASTSLNVTFGYDAYSRLDTMSDGTGSTAYNFDDDNDLTSTQVTYTGLSAQTISYTFYPDGSRETMSTPAGSFTYSYDGNQRLGQLTNPYSESFNWSYLDNDWLSQQQSKNASSAVIATAVATRNAWGLLTEWKNLNGANNVLSDFGGTGSNIMGYDAVANLRSVLVTITNLPNYSGLTSYTNNNQEELTQEQSARLGGYTNTFGYDGAENPTTFRGATLTFNADNQNTANSYDGNGNPTTYKGVSLTFDPENRLTAYGSVMTAGYTGDGLRAWKQNSTGKTYFLYDGLTPVCEMDGNGNVTAVNTFGDNGLLSRHTSTGSVFYTFDPTSNVTQRLDANDNVLGSYCFDAFGNRTSTDNSTDPFSGYGSQDGYYTDWETGLSLLGFRYYDLGTGRFLNRDPIGYDGGVNVYDYVSNNPVNAADPLGWCQINHPRPHHPPNGPKPPPGGPHHGPGGPHPPPKPKPLPYPFPELPHWLPIAGGDIEVGAGGGPLPISGKGTLHIPPLSFNGPVFWKHLTPQEQASIGDDIGKFYQKWYQKRHVPFPLPPTTPKPGAPPPKKK